MLSIANYPQLGPPLQPPPLPDATLYMPNMSNVTWPLGLVPTNSAYPYAYPQPGYPGIQMQPTPRPIATNAAQHPQSLSQPESTPAIAQAATSNPEETSMESS